MKRMLLKLLASVFLVVFAWFAQSNAVFAASSDDNINYVRRDPEDYNFLPLVLEPGSSTGNTGKLRDVISYNMVYDQGYEVQCAKPDWSITPRVYGAIKEYFATYSVPVTLRSNAEYNASFEGGTIPLFRGDEDLEYTQKNSSFEGYFGANYQGSAPPELNSSGVANLLLNQSGRCTAKYGNLESLFGNGGLCSKLKDANQCVLDRDIGSTGFTTKKLYEKLTSIFDKSNGERNINCTDIVGEWFPELLEFDISEDEFDNDIKPTVDALQIAPLNLDILYRLAFLIITPQQSVSNDGGIFDFLQTRSPLPNQVTHSPINEDKHAPIVISFKIPILATNSLFSLPKLRDSALLSAYSMRGIEQLQREQAEIIEERSQFIETIITNKASKPIINCDGLPQCSGGNDSQVLFQALVDIVNGSEQTCSDFKGPYENAGDLGSPAEANEEKEYKDPYFSKVIPITNSAGFSWSLQVNNINVQRDAAKEKVPVSAYLITPYGSNLEYIENTLRSFFNSDNYELMVQNNCIPDFNGECGLIPEYLTFGGITADLDSGSDTFSFLNSQGEPRSFGATTTEQPRDPLRILGGKLGWMIRKLQETIRGIGSKTYEYIKECERTEDLFLGRCLGYLGTPGGTDSQTADSCNDFIGTEVDLPSSFEELGDIVCSVANNDPNDAQLLWGLTQIEGRPMNDQIGAGAETMSCGDLVVNRCGASQIVGIITPQCAENWETDCPQIAWAFDDGEAAKEYRESITPDVVCSVRGSLEYILKLRKSQIGVLKADYEDKWGTEPTIEQIYYMMAAKNLGLSKDIYTNPGCEGADPVSGCDGLNYCQCAMDKFKLSCN